ncbi:uncharacterized protein LOC123302110 [Chrysoperla carnea]|uniref:uncharacterized protein LOC123302110 n=1 Tax=Chrysoperla carnea TaxID=189513 RepID=UPI001D089769|nr:uncharacterized protein LOC123302110 [Chrysoperla carnea]
MDSGYTKYMMLKIRNVRPEDFGSYKCVAKNSLGDTDGVIKLEEIPAPTSLTTTTEITSLVQNRREGDNHIRFKDNDYTLSPTPIQPPAGSISGASTPAASLYLQNHHQQTTATIKYIHHCIATIASLITWILLDILFRLNRMWPINYSLHNA